LSKLDTELRFLLFSNAARPPLIPDDPNFSWITLPSSSSRWWSMVTFPLAARRAKAGAIHTQYTLSPLVQDRGVTTIHDVSFLIGPQWFKPKDRLILKRTVPAAARRAKRVIAVSQTCKGEIERYIPESRGKVAAIYNGLPPWVKRDPDPTPTLQSLGVSRPYLLTVGTQWPRKNMKLAIEAAKLAGVPIVVTGKPGWGEQAEVGKILRVGYVSNEQLCSLYSGASLYLAPSLHEGFGIPVIEAFACGCPVLCSTGGALPEVAGDAAAVEPSWEAAVWADRIASLLGDSGNLSRMRERGVERVKQFDWIESARQTADVYKEVIR
jgi:glycosyltransferase involved in cell wall biosynthesis